MFIELLFCLAGEGTLRARVRPLPTVVHLVPDLKNFFGTYVINASDNKLECLFLENLF
jgi:hypothetical protein